MNIILLNPPTREDVTILRDMAGGLGFGGGGYYLAPLDLALLAGELRKEHEVSIIDSDPEGLGSKNVLERIRKSGPDLVISNVSLPSMEKDSELLKSIRESGIEVLPKTGITYPDTVRDILVRTGSKSCLIGEPEHIILDLISGRTRKGVAYLDNGKLRMPEITRIKELDGLPLPAWDLLDVDRYSYSLLEGKALTMQTSRGCPFPCRYYCPYPLVQGTTWRGMSPERVLDEVRFDVEEHGAERLFFRDAAFTFNIKRAESICDMIVKEGHDLEWWCETRVDLLNRNILEKMRKAGCQGINIGVESGDPELLAKQAKVGLTLEKLKNLKSISDEFGVKLHFLIMVGLPGDSRKSLYNTFKLVKDFRPDSMGVTYVTPYPGTPLYHDAVKHNWITKHSMVDYHGHHPVMRTDSLSLQDIAFAYRSIKKCFSLSISNNFVSRSRLRRLERDFKEWVGK